MEIKILNNETKFLNIGEISFYLTDILSVHKCYNTYENQPYKIVASFKLRKNNWAFDFDNEIERDELYDNLINLLGGISIDEMKQINNVIIGSLGVRNLEI